MKNKYDYLKSVIIHTLSESLKDLESLTKTKSAAQKQAPRYLHLSYLLIQISLFMKSRILNSIKLMQLPVL